MKKGRFPKTLSLKNLFQEWFSHLQEATLVEFSPVSLIKITTRRTNFPKNPLKNRSQKWISVQEGVFVGRIFPCIIHPIPSKQMVFSQKTLKNMQKESGYMQTPKNSFGQKYFPNHPHKLLQNEMCQGLTN